MARCALLLYPLIALLLAVGSAFADDADEFATDEASVASSGYEGITLVQLEAYPDASLGNYATTPSVAESDPFAGSFAFTAGWLFLKPMVDDTYFALDSASSTTFPNGTRINNEFGYESAFRVGAAYKFRATNRVFQVNYMRLDSDASKTVAGDFLWASSGRADLTSSFENYAGTAASSIDVTFDRIDASFSQPWPVFNDNMYFRYGMEYANIDLSENHAFVSALTTGTVSQDSQTIGVGPEFGIGIDHALTPLNRWTPGVLSMNMVTTASLLIGQSHGRVNNVLGGVPLLDVIDDNASRIIPALHARVDLDYAVNISHCQTTFTVGYEFHSYIQAISRAFFPDDVADGLATTEYANFDLQGLFLSATVLY